MLANRSEGTIARRTSIHRATTIGPKSPLYQVILRNTSAAREGPTVSSNRSINRSQSLLTTNSRIPVLAPARAERARLEAMLADERTCRSSIGVVNDAQAERGEHHRRVQQALGELGQFAAAQGQKRDHKYRRFLIRYENGKTDERGWISEGGPDDGGAREESGADAFRICRSGLRP
ncbi:hypothetical protein VTH82DRAFT_3514 [Thermothelomyces myriococcoides]